MYDEELVEAIGGVLISFEEYKAKNPGLSEAKLASSLTRTNNNNLYEKMAEYIDKNRRFGFLL